MQVYLISALAHRAREKHQVFSAPRLSGNRNAIRIPRLFPTLWRMVQVRWRTGRMATTAKQLNK
ncbi:hypothetical protein P4E94_12280 [Pontiellaceae bacterium B12219]|nr:hypothetical protein [Pontiellaceae bacterium B12219]